MRTLIPRRVQIETRATEKGLSADCPFCGATNTAPFGPDGRVIWWPSKEHGEWCRHNEGAYAGVGASTVLLFHGYASVGRPTSEAGA